MHGGGEGVVFQRSINPEREGCDKYQYRTTLSCFWKYLVEGEEILQRIKRTWYALSTLTVVVEKTSSAEKKRWHHCANPTLSCAAGLK